MSNDLVLVESPSATLVSVDEFQRMIDAGEIAEDAPVELLEGRIVQKMVKHPPHVMTMKRLTRLLYRVLPDGWHPQFQDPIRLTDSVPEPDAAVIRGEPEDFSRLAGCGDVGLVIEVADTTVNKDRRKAVLYARNGIPRYWLINLPDDCIEVYEALTPGAPEAFYKHVETHSREQSLDLTLDEHAIARVAVADILPPATEGSNS
jgi:Uma2 family endonuclease